MLTKFVQSADDECVIGWSFFDDKQRMFVSGQAFALTDGISAKSLVFSQESAIAEFDGAGGF